MATGISISHPSADDIESGKGELNYIEDNPSAKVNITGWTASGSNLTVARTDTASELPREQLTGTGIKIMGGASDPTGEYIYYDFTLDDADLGKLLKIQWAQQTQGTYAAADLNVYIAAQTDRTTAIATPVITDIPAEDNITFLTSFMSTSTTAVSLVIKAAANMSATEGIVISDVVVGPGSIAQGAVVGSWTSYTPTIGSGVGTSAEDARWRRVGENMEIVAKVTCDGTGTGVFQIDLPSGYTISSTNLPANETANFTFGNLALYDASGNDAYFATAYSDGTSTFTFYNHGLNNDTFGYNSPVTIVSGDKISVMLTVPISGWEAQGTMNALQQDNLNEWQDFDPQFTNFTDAGDRQGRWRRIGDSMEVSIYADSDTTVGGTIAVDLPTGYTVDTSKLPTTVANYQMVGQAYAVDTGNAFHPGMVIYNDSTSVRILNGYATGAGAQVDLWKAAVPFTWGAGDKINIQFTVPITEFAGSQSSLVGFAEATATEAGLIPSYAFDDTFSPTLVGHSNVTGTPTVNNADVVKIGKKVDIYMDLQIDPTSTGETLVRFATSALPYTPRDEVLLQGICTRNSSLTDEGGIGATGGNVYITCNVSNTADQAFGAHFSYTTDD